ncbi:MAG: hypothetical protein Q4A43_02725 [Coriobacteriia bacterium]|nr:hypothetical protein [Coriobacteriia bacterium]
MITEMENAPVGQAQQRQVRPVLLCVGVDQIAPLAKLGLGRKNWSESWIGVCHSSQEARELVAENEGILEVWVYGSNDMEAMNLAAGLKFERNSLRVFLLADSGTGSFMSRCDAAHIVARVGSNAVIGLFASAEQVYGGAPKACKEEIVRQEDAFCLGDAQESGAVSAYAPEPQSSPLHDTHGATAKVFSSAGGELDAIPELEEPARAFAGGGVPHDSSSLETVPFKVVKSRSSGPANLPTSNDSFVLSVVSGSGGSGKSSIAAMIACLSQMAGAKTLVVDADFQFGDEPWLLGRKAPFDLVELVRHENRIGELVCEGGLPAVLSAPERLEDSELAVVSIKQLVALARPYFDVIVVNTGSFWVDAHLDLLEVSDRSLFVMDQRPTSIRSCARAIELCVRCGLPLQRFSFVLNGCGRQALLSSLDASCALKGVKVGELRDGGDELAELLGAGLPLELIEARNPFVMDLASFVDDLLPLPSSTLRLLGKGGSKRMRRRRPQKPKRRRAS